MTGFESHAGGPAQLVQRRTLLKGLGAAGAAAGLSVYARPSVAQAAVPGKGAGAGGPAKGAITGAGVNRAVRRLSKIVEKNIAATDIPGLAVAVVYDGEVRYLAGHGLRQVGKTAKVDADTVFYLASVSKPISSTVIGAALTKKLTKVSWDDTVASQLRGFTLSDPWVGSHVTVADMFSHRSGLPDHAGNLLEDLGYDRSQIIDKLAAYPLFRFRDHYDYTNYGLTAGAEAIARSTGRSWSALADETIFRPLGMTSSSFTFAGLESRRNRVALHHLVKGTYRAGPDADYEPQAPAGAASASVRDMAKWMTMLLAGGRHNATTLVDPKQLARIWSPAFPKRLPAEIGEWASFYGMGWNVSYERTGELQVSHSGAFARGASTSITMYPADKLAIVVLTNAAPRGVPEAISAEFVDVVRYGKSTQKSWLDVIAPFVTETPTADQIKYSKPAVQPKPARNLSAYTGTYQNSFYGDLTVSARSGGLWFTVGPNRELHALRHYSGDEFYFTTTGEDASGFSGAVFAGSSSRITSLTINAWNRDKLGTFRRS